MTVRASVVDAEGGMNEQASIAITLLWACLAVVLYGYVIQLVHYRRGSMRELLIVATLICVLGGLMSVLHHSRLHIA